MMASICINIYLYGRINDSLSRRFVELKQNEVQMKRRPCLFVLGRLLRLLLFRGVAMSKIKATIEGRRNFSI